MLTDEETQKMLEGVQWQLERIKKDDFAYAIQLVSLNIKNISLLSKWAAELNYHKTPEDFHMVLEDNEQRMVFNLLMSLVPHKEFLRAWNVNILNKSNDQFETWWNERLKNA